MKKLVCAAVVAASMCAMADEAKKEVAPAAAPAAAAVAKPVAPKRPQMSEEQRAKMREQREKFMAERKAAMEAKMLEVVKKYVPEEDKAKALIKELQESMIGARRPMMPRPMMNRPAPKVETPAEAAKPAAK